MLVCPFCGEGLAQQGRQNWFQCPSCGNWVRPRVNRAGLVWIEAGVFVNVNIQAVQLAQPRGQAPNAVPAADLAIIARMDLPTVQRMRQRIFAGLPEIEKKIDWISVMQSQNRQNGQLFRQYAELLRQHRQERNYWELIDERLKEREIILQQEGSRAWRAGLGRAMIFILVGTGVFTVGIYLFTQKFGLQLDLQAMLFAVLIAAVSAFFTWLISWLIA